METRDDQSGTRLGHTLTLNDLESSGGVIDDANVDSGWDDTTTGEFLPCSTAFAR